MPVDNQVYDSLAATWWDDGQVLNLLRSWLNPARFGYFVEVLRREGVNCEARLRAGTDPLAALDVGCGGGLLAEEFARLGCAVTGVDPSEASLATAREHAEGEGLSIDYQRAVGEDLPFDEDTFDLVYCCDVLEHVQSVPQTVSEIARVMRPGGLFLYDTINRTPFSKLVSIKVAQDWKATSFMPPNLHSYDQFVTPSELDDAFAAAGLEGCDRVGLVPKANPVKVLKALRDRKKGRIDFAEMARRAPIGVGRDIRGSYAGYARRPGGAGEGDRA